VGLPPLSFRVYGSLRRGIEGGGRCSRGVRPILSRPSLLPADLNGEGDDAVGDTADPVSALIPSFYFLIPTGKELCAGRKGAQKCYVRQCRYAYSS